MSEILQFGAARPREGTEYSPVLDRGEAAGPARLLVAVTEAFVGGAALRVALEGSADGATFAPVAEGQLHLADRLTPGARLIEAAALPGGLRWLRLRYESAGRHRLGELHAALVLPAVSNTAIGPTVASTYSAIAAEQQAIDLEIRRQKFGEAAEPALEQHPANPAGIWNTVDRD